MDPASHNATANKEEPYMFECGTPYRFAPPPMKEGLDCWEEILKPLKAYDDAQCASWKEEVQNVLIFASLFSAVVTAFIIESYKQLKPDPNDATVALLSRIAARLDAAANASTPFDPIQSQTPFSPQPAMVRVNVFWILSLVVSLTTVLIGIVSSQWLREHQHYPEHYLFEEKFGLLHMRLEMMEAWKVPGFFASLPILLQLALILFFIGLADFLHSMGVTQVTVPIIVAISLSLLFLVVTTALPALQAFTVIFRQTQMNKNVPVPCPYKSPHARLFRLVLSSRLGILFTVFTFISTYSLVVACINFAQSLDIRQRLRNHVFRSPQSPPTQHHPSNHSAGSQPYYGSLNPVTVKWEELDLEWISARRFYSTRSLSRMPLYNGGFKRGLKYGPQYDQIRGIQQVCQRYQNHTPTLLSAYHCFVRCIAGADVPAGLAEHDARPRDSWASQYYQTAKELLMSSPGISSRSEIGYLSPNCADKGPGISYDEMFLVFVNRVLQEQALVVPTLMEILFRTWHYFEDHQLVAPAEQQSRASILFYYNVNIWNHRHLLSDLRRVRSEYLAFVIHQLAGGRKTRIPPEAFGIRNLTHALEGFLEGREFPINAVVVLSNNLDLSVRAVDDPTDHGFGLHENHKDLDETAVTFLLSYSLISTYLSLRRSSTLTWGIPSGVLELARSCDNFCRVLRSNREATHVAGIVDRMERFFILLSVGQGIWNIIEKVESILEELSNSDNGASGAQLSSTQPASRPSSSRLSPSSPTCEQELTTAGIVASSSASSDANNEEQPAITTLPQDATTADLTSDNPYPSRDPKAAEDP